MEPAEAMIIKAMLANHILHMKKAVKMWGNPCVLLHGRKKTPQAADVKQRKPVEVAAVVTLGAIKLENPNPILRLDVHGLPLAHIKREIPFIKLTHHQIHPQIRG